MTDTKKLKPGWPDWIEVAPCPARVRYCQSAGYCYTHLCRLRATSELADPAPTTIPETV